MRTRPLPRLAAAGLSAGALAFALAACGGGTTSSAAPASSAASSSAATSSAHSSSPSSSASAGTASASTASASTATTVTATEADFSIALSSSTLPAGTYTFTVVNAGKATHSLEFQGPGLGKTVSANVQGGQSTTMTVTLQPGTYDVFCPIGNHRQMGMDTKLTVS